VRFKLRNERRREKEREIPLIFKRFAGLRENPADTWRPLKGQVGGTPIKRILDAISLTLEKIKRNTKPKIKK